MEGGSQGGNGREGKKGMRERKKNEGSNGREGEKGVREVMVWTAVGGKGYV